MELRYFISLKWCEENDRSLPHLARSRMCPECQSKLGGEGGLDKLRYEDLLAIIGDCCSRKPEFITPGLPLKEVVFRTFLANGNQPLSLDEICQQLEEVRSIKVSPENLRRIFDNDRYYGLRPVPDEEGA